MSADVIVRLAGIEAQNLIVLIDELVEVVDAEGADADPGVARLTPDAYPDDAQASAEFEQATRATLIDRRRADARIVRRTLEPIADLADAEDAPLREHRLTLDDEQTDAWMRTLAAMRLVVATRVGITDADEHDVDDPAFHVYDWLGYRLELLVRAADERDLSR